MDGVQLQKWVSRGCVPEEVMPAVQSLIQRYGWRVPTPAFDGLCHALET